MFTNGNVSSISGGETTMDEFVKLFAQLTIEEKEEALEFIRALKVENGDNQEPVLLPPLIDS